MAQSFNLTEYRYPGLLSASCPGIVSPPPFCLGDIIRLGDRPIILFTTLPIAQLRPDVQSFIDTNEMWQVLEVAYAVKDELDRTMAVDMQIALERDAEALDREELVIIYSVANKEYKEILRIWDDVSRGVHQALPTTFSDRVYVRLAKA